MQQLCILHDNTWFHLLHNNAHNIYVICMELHIYAINNKCVELYCRQHVWLLAITTVVLVCFILFAWLVVFGTTGPWLRTRSTCTVDVLVSLNNNGSAFNMLKSAMAMARYHLHCSMHRLCGLVHVSCNQVTSL